MGYFDWFWDYFGDADSNAMKSATTHTAVQTAATNLAAKDKEGGCTSASYRDKGMTRPCCICNSPAMKCWRVDGAYGANPVASPQHNDEGDQTIGCCAPDGMTSDAMEYVCAGSAADAEKMFQVTEDDETQTSDAESLIFSAEYRGNLAHRDMGTIPPPQF